MAMCGIVGYVGNGKALPVLLDGMGRLEYRGYDSAGVAIMVNGNITCVKEVCVLKELGIVENLNAKIKSNFEKLNGSIGIGHTRWATHGEPSVANAHPHMDCTGKIQVVHNGIIENYNDLKKMLEQKGHVFVSQTDTEVIAHLIEEFNEGDIEAAFKKTVKELEGAYSILMISEYEPEKIFVVRNSSPMVLGIGNDEIIIASCETAIVNYTRKVNHLKDGEIAVVQKDGYVICDADNNHVEKTIEEVTCSIDDIEKGGYKHFMLKEIFEQPDSILNAIRGRFNKAEGLVVTDCLSREAERLKLVDNILVVACGTAFIAGFYGEYLIEHFAGIPVKAITASEFRYRRWIVTDKTLVLVVSQSGSTADTVKVVKEANKRNCLTMAIVNVVGSQIAKEVAAGIFNHAGHEISVASTKVFTSQVSIFVLIAMFLARQRGMSVSEAVTIYNELVLIPEKVKAVLQNEPKIKAVAKKYRSVKNCAFIGREFNYPTALEGALKLKELSYVHAEGYPAGELKHGPIALIDPKFLTIGIIPQDDVYAKTASNLQEVKARKGPVIAIATEGDAEIGKIADDVIYIPPAPDYLNIILATVVLQLFAYHMAILKKCNVDKPRNLAKSVTVE